MNNVLFRLYDLFFLWWINGKCPFIVMYICQPHFKSLASVFSILYICTHYHFLLAGSYTPSSVFPNYILRIVSSFLRSFRFLLSVFLYVLHLFTYSAITLTYGTSLQYLSNTPYGRMGEWKYKFTHPCPAGKNGYW